MEMTHVNGSTPMVFPTNELYTGHNCTLGNRWLWRHVGQCVSDDGVLVGVLMSLLSIILCLFTHVIMYLLHQNFSYSRGGSRHHMTCVIVSHWLAEMLSLLGCLMTGQLLMQALFALTGVFINTFLFLHAVFCSSNGCSTDETPGFTGKPRVSTCVLPGCFTLVSIMTVATICLVTSHQTDPLATAHVRIKRRIQVSWNLVEAGGFCLGSMSAVMSWVTKSNDVISSYRPQNCIHVLISTLIISMFGDTLYVAGIVSQESSVYLILRALPWILTRAGLAGINVGIIIQTVLMTKQSRCIETSYTDVMQMDNSDFEWSGDDENSVNTCLSSTSSVLPEVKDRPYEKVTVQQLEDTVKALVTAQKSFMALPPQNVMKCTYVESSCSSSSGIQELEWDFECAADQRPLMSSHRRTQKTSLRSISSLEENSGHQKVVEWFKGQDR